MKTEPLPEVVDAAKRGQPGAFAELVARFQDMAVGSAVGLLSDPELARDAAQEAFVEAFLKLDQLRDARAFAGWFRRIVVKHCDRIQRRRRLLPALQRVGAPRRGVSRDRRGARAAGTVAAGVVPGVGT